MEYQFWIIGFVLLIVIAFFNYKNNFEKKIEYQEKQRADKKIREAKVTAEEQVRKAQRMAAEEIREAKEGIESNKEKLATMSEKELLVHVVSALDGYSTRIARIEKQILSIKSGINIKENESVFVCNTLTKKFHCLSCSSVTEIAPGKRMYSFESADVLENNGYIPCTNCRPDMQQRSPRAI